MNLKNSRILVSNDDGIGAEGIALLEKIALSLSDDVWVIAPLHEQSGAGHSLSLHSPIRYKQISEKRFAVAGTPTDCVLIGVQEILRDKKPDLVLSGINYGNNLAEDITYSGTIAAAMEATLLSIPAIAFSNSRIGDNVNWQIAEKYVSEIISKLTTEQWPDGVLMNVNFPPCLPGDVKGIKFCAHGRRKLDDNLDRRVDPQGRPYIWIGGQRKESYSAEFGGSDFEFIQKGYITITPINMDMTDYKFLNTLGEWK